MIQVKSKFENTAVVPADAGPAARIPQGRPVTFRAKNLHPAATHDWDLGDGASATGALVTHTYAASGFYVVKLATVVNQPGGARTRHFVALFVSNVPPVVDAGPAVTVNEGEAISMSGSFSDAGQFDNHTASWAWGDDDPPTAATVIGHDDPPVGTGTATAVHAWGDAGTYTATLAVRDDHGGLGEDQTTVKVLNVPPRVDPGPPMFAYPHTVCTLEGKFTDAGWLNTHVGSWDLGDGSPVVTATVLEQHKPPEGIGTAVASHIYRAVGCHCCTCTVIDDRGGVGVAYKAIRVVDVCNAGFEDGFRGLLAGAVANEWEPYAATIAAFQVASQGSAPVVGTFAAEDLVVRGGQRSQRIHVDPRMRAGVYQQIGANPGWVYQITAWYCLLEGSGGMVRMAVDPTGGTDPTAAGISWTIGRALGRWEQLATRVVASGDAITIFLEATGQYQLTRVEEKEITTAPARRDRARATDACFDRVQLVAAQPLCPPDISKPAANHDPDRDPNHEPEPDRGVDRDPAYPAGSDPTENPTDEGQ